MHIVVVDVSHMGMWHLGQWYLGQWDSGKCNVGQCHSGQLSLSPNFVCHLNQLFFVTKVIFCRPCLRQDLWLRPRVWPPAFRALSQNFSGFSWRAPRTPSPWTALLDALPRDPPTAGTPTFPFFFSSPATIFILSSLCCGSSRGNFGGELQTCTFTGPGAAKHHPNSHEQTPKRGEKERKLWREGEKSAKFWAPTFRGLTAFWGPTVPLPSSLLVGEKLLPKKLKSCSQKIA